MNENAPSNKGLHPARVSVPLIENMRVIALMWAGDAERYPRVMDTNQDYWQQFLVAKPDVPADTPYQVWYFGNSSEQARELAGLVLAGKKTATASLLETNKLQPEKAPMDDGYSVVTDFEGSPMCVIQTTQIRHLPFREVDAEFAHDEGEDDRTLESWRRGHREYFTREAAELGFAFDEDSIVCCERFRLLFPK